MRVRFLISAHQDMQSIKAYLAKENPQTAKRLIQKFRESTDRLKEFPQSGRMIPELNNPNLRESLVDRYRIMYQVDESSVNVFAVYDSRRAYPPPPEG